MTRRKDQGLGGNGGQFASQTPGEADVDLSDSLTERDRQSLQDLVEFAETGARLVARGRTAYDEDEMLRLAAESVIHRLGEAVGRLSDDVIAANPQVQWRGMKGMRNVVAHEYGAIDHNIVWNSLENDLPREAAEMRKILDA